MASPSRYFAAALIVLGLAPGAGAQGLAPAPARQPDSEPDLLGRLEREQNPVKKAKYQVRLGRILQAIDAYDQGSLEQGQRLLEAYLGRMKGSWQTLRDSGRRAVRQPQGFKELDIALREDARRLEDLKHHVPYTDRDPVEKVAQEVERIRAEVLHALFPAERPAEDRNSFVGLSREDFPIGKSSA
jgi:hypothetical protein